MVGESIMERYTVERPIGRGGSGVVYQGRDQRLRRSVAIKVIHSEEPQRVLREAQAVARLSHPGIVTLYEFGTHRDQAVLVSELIQGATLRELANSGELDDRRLAYMGSELCSALAHAHERGVIHRDIKPDNLIAREGAITGGERGPGQVKLTDFGIAHIDDSPRLTRTGMMSGTLAYMAPETLDGDPADPATDTYALAVTLRELWTGRNDLDFGNYASTVKAIQVGLEPLELQRPDLPLELTRTIDSCLDPNPDCRPEPSNLGQVLAEAAPLIDPDPVPRPHDAEPMIESTSLAPPTWSIALSAAVVACAAIVGTPGLALLLALLGAPALAALQANKGAVPTLAAAPLSALSAGILVPVIAAAMTRRVVPVVIAGWVWALSLGEILGFGPLASHPRRGSGAWVTDIQAALERLVLPLADPSALALLTIWLGAALGLRALLNLRQPAYAAIGVLPWAALLASASALVPDLGAPPIVTSMLLVGSAIAVVTLVRLDGELEADQQPSAPIAWLTDHGIGLGLRSSHGHG